MATLQLLRAPFVAAALCATAVGFAASWGDDYVLYVLSLTCVYVVFAVGYNILLGCAGQLDFGQSAFLAIGAYTVAILQLHYGQSFWIALPVSGLLAAAVGVAIGVIVLRLQGFYLALVTLGFSQTVVLGISLSGEFTGGYQGMSVTQPGLFGLPKPLGLFIIVLSITAFLTGAATNLLRSRAGLAFFAIKENELAARAMGVNLTRYRVLAYAVSAFYAGIAGGLMAVVLSYITPEGFGILENIKALTMVAVGGMGSVIGSAAGAAILTISGELLRFSNTFLEIGNGLLLLLAIMFMPDGIYGLYAHWRFRSQTSAPAPAPQ